LLGPRQLGDARGPANSGPGRAFVQGAFDSAAAAFVLTELLVNALLDKLGDQALERMRRWETATAHQVQGTAR